jgi:hypothetical protein
MPLKRQSTANSKCQATTKAGRQCAAPAVHGNAYGGSTHREDGPETGDLAHIALRLSGWTRKLRTTLAYIAASLLNAIEVADIDDRLKTFERSRRTPTKSTS